MPEISHQQAEALRGLEWLLTEDDGQRRTGRSQIMALAYLRFALNRMRGVRWTGRPTSWVRVVDHTHTTYMGTMTNTSRIVLGYIEDMAQDAGLGVEVSPTQHRFRITGLLGGDPDWGTPFRYIFDDFVETDIQRGFPPEQIARRRAMNPPEAAEPLPRALARVMDWGRELQAEGRITPPQQTYTTTTHIQIPRQGADGYATAVHIASQSILTAEDERILASLDDPNEPLERTPRPRIGPTIREMALHYVTLHPGLSATQIALAIERPAASVSSTLAKEAEKGNVLRENGQGPRGGWTYSPLAPPPPLVSVWDRLRVNPFKDP